MRRSWIAWALVAGLLLGLPATAQGFVPADEARVHAMVNATRAQRGLLPLDRVEGLVTLAREQSVRMERNGSIYHNPALKAGLDASGLDWHWSGENVGVGPDVATIQQAFLGSQHHLENIVRANYTALGVGVVSDGDGYVYVTQVFAELGARSTRPAPPPPPPAPVATPTPQTPKLLPSPPAAPVPTAQPPDPVVIGGGITVGGPIP